MCRRTLFAGVGGALLAAPLQHAARATASPRSTLRFVPQTDLVNMDPIWGPSYSVRNAALLVWDTLYGSRNYASTTLEAEKAIAERINVAALEDVVFVPTGQFLSKQAWRSSVDGVITAPIPVFWGVSKTA